MLAQPASDLDEAFANLTQDTWLEWKLDGARIQVHKAGDEIGLGLSIVRDCADAIGASITVDAAPGEGTTFTISMPVGTYSR
jgi:light-regulated signal transduction histidine kinase (bacteriophytochrome)